MLSRDQVLGRVIGHAPWCLTVDGAAVEEVDREPDDLFKPRALPLRGERWCQGSPSAEWPLGTPHRRWCRLPELRQGAQIDRRRGAQPWAVPSESFDPTPEQELPTRNDFATKGGARRAVPKLIDNYNTCCRDGSTSSPSSSLPPNASMTSMYSRITWRMAVVEMLPTRSHTTFGGGPWRNAS